MPRTIFVGLACAAVLGMGAVAQAPARGRTAAVPAKPLLTAKIQGGKDPFAGEPLVVERLDTVYRYNADGTGTKVDTRVLRVGNEAGRRAALVTSLVYPTMSRRVEVVYLRVRKPNGTVVETPPSDAGDGPAPVAAIAPAYGDVHVLQIGARGLTVGDRVESEVRTTITKAEAEGQFWGSEHVRLGDAVVLERAVELRVPKGRNVLVSSPHLPSAMTEEGGEKVFRWKGSQLKPSAKSGAARVGDAGGDGDDAEEDEAGGDPERTAPIAWTTFSNWAEVGAWYRGVAGESAAATPSLKARADHVVYGLKTPEARIQALYGYVSSEVRSIDVPWGPGQYAPHAAGEVLSSLYGNSNDKSTVLVALLRAEGIAASTALVGAGTEVDEKVPSPGWFDHVVTVVNGGTDGEFWLDTSAEEAPFRMLRVALRDRPALVIPPEGQSVVKRTPADLPFAAYNRFEAKGTLSPSGTLQAHADVTLRGDEELRYRTGFRSVGPTRWDQVSAFFVRTNGMAGDASNTSAERVDDAGQALHFGFDLAQSTFGDWPNFRITPLEPGLNLPLTDRKSAPGEDVELGGKRTDTVVSRIALPPEYGADLPAAQHLHSDFATLDRTYKLEKSAGGQVLVTERSLTITAAKVPVAQWPAYRKFLDEIGDHEPWVQLTSAARPGPAAHAPPVAGLDNPAAAQMVAKADAAIEKKRYDQATVSLDAAKKVNDRQALLWSSYGVIAQRGGRLDEAVEDFRRELTVHPGEAFVSQLLAVALATQGKNEEATGVLRAALVLNPGDVRTAELLARMLPRTDKAGAEKVLRDALAASPEDPRLKLRLGTLLVEEGKREEGGALLLAVATGSQNAEQLNDAAYALADASLDLRVAEAAGRRAVQLLNAETARPEGGVASRAALERTAQLVSAWDTYGWVLYREANYSEAEPWLRAAWEDSYGASAGSHLGALLGKQGRTADAARVLRLAAQGEREDQGIESPTGENHEAPAEKSRPSARGQALAGEHTVFVPGTAGMPGGQALFEFEYALNTAPQVRFVRGDNALAGVAETLRKVDTRTVLPAGSPAHLLRRGELHCLGGANCMLEVFSTRRALEE